MKDQKVRHQGIVALNSFIALIVSGTVIFHQLEDWTWIQSFYFTIVTLTTVGYGDLTPSTDETRLVASIFIILGVGVAVASIGIIGGGVINRRTNKKFEKKSIK